MNISLGVCGTGGLFFCHSYCNLRINSFHFSCGHCGLQIAQGMLALELCDPPILHRDLKPSNIFIDGCGHARVGDFGLARRLPVTNMSTLTSETGTYVYMSPEMVRHEIYDAKTDVWSWGVVLCELCTNVSCQRLIFCCCAECFLWNFS